MRAMCLALAAIATAPGCSRPQPATATVWEEPLTHVRFRAIPPARFVMGTPDHERLREAQEKQHEVVLARGFYIAETEVTQAQWTRVMTENPSHFEECGPSCPVETVTWYDAQRFIERLNRLSTPGFRLPTEAEWELACRAGGRQAFGGRSTLGSADANIDGRFPYGAPSGPHRGSPTPVGRFGANAFGLFDMSGNVWEWTQDEHCPYPSGAAADPLGACGSDRRVIRGGSWAFDGGSARCGLRFTHRPQDKGYSLGLRLAHDLF
jgi:formylglycine-generating enzyme required for sulfatase activity